MADAPQCIFGERERREPPCQPLLTLAPWTSVSPLPLQFPLPAPWDLAQTSAGQMDPPCCRDPSLCGEALPSWDQLARPSHRHPAEEGSGAFNGTPDPACGWLQFLRGTSRCWPSQTPRGQVPSAWLPAPRPAGSGERRDGGPLERWLPWDYSGLLALWDIVLGKPRPCFSCTSQGPGPGAEAGFEVRQGVGVTCSSQILAELAVNASGSRLRIPLFRGEFWAKSCQKPPCGPKVL